MANGMIEAASTRIYTLAQPTSQGVGKTTRNNTHKDNVYVKGYVGFHIDGFLSIIMDFHSTPKKRLDNWLGAEE